MPRPPPPSSLSFSLSLILQIQALKPVIDSSGQFRAQTLNLQTTSCLKYIHFLFCFHWLWNQTRALGCKWLSLLRVRKGTHLSFFFCEGRTVFMCIFIIIFIYLFIYPTDHLWCSLGCWKASKSQLGCRLGCWKQYSRSSYHLTSTFQGLVM